MAPKTPGASLVGRFSPPIPIVRSYDEAKTREFYVDFLGFRIDWEHRFEEGTPLYMQVTLGACSIQISEHFGDGTPGAKIKIETRDLEAFRDELLAKNYRHARPDITEHDWGERSMSINDPSGNALVFFERVEAR